MTVKKPEYVIEYENKDITRLINPYVLSIAYEDKKHGESDELEIELSDSNNLWKSDWLPQKGDSINLKIGYAGQNLINCGNFNVDEVEFSGEPDVVVIKALSASITKALRQKNSKAYDNKTLKQIAKEIAEKHKYKFVSDTQEDIKIRRITQKKQGDLAFLKRLADEYGYTFKITENKLVFFQVEALDKEDKIFILTRAHIKSYKFTLKTLDSYKNCEVSYFCPKTKELIAHKEDNPNGTKDDSLKLNERCENKEQAIKKAKAGISNSKKGIEADLEITGNPHIFTGSNIEITEFFKLNGKYSIENTRHSFSANEGYITSLELKRLNNV